MKTLFALCVLMIGLLCMPPGPVQASNDQSPGSCFVLQVDNFAPAEFVQEVATATVMHNFVSLICISANVINLPIVSYCSDKQVIMKLPDVALFSTDRTCLITYEYNRFLNLLSPKMEPQNIISGYRPIQIRADTQNM